MDMNIFVFFTKVKSLQKPYIVYASNEHTSYKYTISTKQIISTYIAHLSE